MTFEAIRVSSILTFINDNNYQSINPIHFIFCNATI